MSSGFISEKEVAERRRIRQENWEKSRNEVDPEEAPEEPPPDSRSLYDRLQEQRQKKQEEYDEAHKFVLSGLCQTALFIHFKINAWQLFSFGDLPVGNMYYGAVQLSLYLVS